MQRSKRLNALATNMHQWLKTATGIYFYPPRRFFRLRNVVVKPVVFAGVLFAAVVLVVWVLAPALLDADVLVAVALAAAAAAPVLFLTVLVAIGLAGAFLPPRLFPPEILVPLFLVAEPLGSGPDPGQKPRSYGLGAILILLPRLCGAYPWLDL